MYNVNMGTPSNNIWPRAAIYYKANMITNILRDGYQEENALAIDNFTFQTCKLLDPPSILI